MTIEANTVIKNYKIIRKIGSGGMGEVFEAEDISLHRKVAIKILNPELLTSELIVKRFKQEATILASLKHDNIVKVFSFFENKGNYFMVMEYIDGLTIKDRLAKTGLISESKAILIIEQVLDALRYAHDMKVIHRDIKSSNIMITNTGVVKLMDFGIAKQLSEEFPKDYGLTSTVAQLGTIHYMSPEQIKSTKTVDNRTDIFSLGITFFEILTANLPYNIKDKSEFDIMNQIVQVPLPDPRKYYPHISDQTVSILKKMTEKEVEKRFKGCEEIFWISLQPTDSPIVNIGQAEWMAKNLNIDYYRNGDQIPEVTDFEEWDNLTTGAWCYYDNEPANGAIYGKLYNWYAVNDPRGLAPTGWHVASDAEWTTLANSIGGESIAGGKLKESGTSHWQSSDTKTSDEIGFSALPGGYHNLNETCSNIGGFGLWWSSTEYNTTEAWYRILATSTDSIGRNHTLKENGLSVRCVKD